MSDLTALAVQIASLPRDENPYDFAAQLVSQSLLPAVSNSFGHQAACTGALTCLAWLAAAVTVVLNLRENRWLFRSRQTPKGSIYLPHTALLFSIVGLVALTFGLAMHVELYRAFFLRSSRAVMRLMTLVPLVWCLSCAANVFEVWGCASSAWLVRVAMRQPRTMRAGVVNAVFILLLVLLCFVVMPVFAVGLSHLAKAIDAADAVRDLLISAGATWSAGQPFVFPASGFALLSDGTAQLDRYTTFAQIGFGLLSGTIVILVAIFIPAGLGQIAILRSQSALMRTQLARRRRNSIVVKLEPMTRSVRMLELEILAVLCAAVVFGANSIWVASDYKSIIAHSRKIEGTYLLSLWTYALTSLPIYGLLAYRSFVPALRRRRLEARRIVRRAKSIEGAPSAGVTVSVSHHVSIDDGSDQDSMTFEPLDHLDAANQAIKQLDEAYPHLSRQTAIVLPTLEPSYDSKLEENRSSSFFVD